MNGRGSVLCLWISVVMALLIGVGPVLAQEQTGAVEGTVTDNEGAALPGVTVSISGSNLPSGLRVVSSERGRYRFPAVPPGDYSMTAELAGFQTVELPELRVSLGSQLQADFEMYLDTFEEAIVVKAAPIISLTASDTSAVISNEWVEKLPVGRDFTSVVSQAAGANDEDDLLGGISIDGSSGAENRFIVDGIDTTNLQTGVSEKRLLTDFLEEVQVKAGGYNAEFGGSTGGVINAVTKSGGNDFKGDLHTYYDSSDFEGDVRPTLQRNPNTGAAEYVSFREDDTDRLEPGFTLGGPIVRDKVWFFAAYSPSFNDNTRTVEYSDGTTNDFFREDDNDYATANVTASLGPVFLKVSGNLSDFERNNLLPAANGTGSRAIDAYDVDQVQPNESYSGNLDWLATPNLSFNLRGGHFEYDTRDTGFSTEAWIAFSTTSAGRPGVLFPNFPASLDRPLGNITPANDGTSFDFFERDALQADGTYFVDSSFGEHEIKAGVLFEEIGNEVLDGYADTRILFYWGRSITDLTGVSRTGEFGHYRVLQIATQGNVSSQNSSLFIQDSWRPTDRLTFNIGVRAEKEKIPSFSDSPNIPTTAIEFDYEDKLAPRFGFAYDVRGDGRWKAYGSYGIFYDNTKLEMPRGSFGGDRWVDWYFGLDTFDWQSIADSCRIVVNSIDAGLPPGCPGTFLFAADRRHPSNDPVAPTIDPNLEPLESNEISLGVEHLLTPNISVGARYVHKELKRTIEDVGIVVPGVGEVFYIANPGEGVAQNILGSQFPDQPKPVRDYDGITLNIRKNFSNSWALNASYTYSRLYGNYSGLASSDEDGRLSPNVNRFFDSLNGSFDAQGNPVYGRLSTDRPHQFKAQFIYLTPWGTTVGLDQRVASGTPVSTEYSVSPGLPFFPYGRGDQGRTPTYSNTDLYLAHEFKIGGRFSFELSLSVFNLFDQDTAIDIDNTGLLEDLPLNEEEFFAGFDPEQVIDSEDIGRDPLFGLAEQFQAPRTMRFGAKFRF